MRHKDSDFRRKHQLTRRLNTNTINTTTATNETETRQTQKKQTKIFSAQKRRILIFDVFKRIPKKTCTKSGQLELAKNNDDDQNDV